MGIPFVVLHGSDDRVTDPANSAALYNTSKIKDKTLHIYEGGWHCLLHGDTPEFIQRVEKDIFSWLQSHCDVVSPKLNSKSLSPQPVRRKGSK